MCSQMTLVFVILLIIHTYTDLRYMLLYDYVTLALAICGLARAVYMQQLIAALQGAGVLLAVMLVLYFASRGGMGEGDVKLAPALGLWLHTEQGLLCLLLAFVSGALVGCALLLCGKGRRSAIPFGPFLCAGALAAYFVGARIIWWYWHFMINLA